MFSKLKQFKDLRDKSKSIQTALSQYTVEGSGGWGKVKIVMDGTQKVLSVTIDPTATSDVAKLGEMIREAMNDTNEKLQKLLAGKMKELGGGDLAKQMQDLMGG